MNKKEQLKFVHRYVKGITCQVIEQTRTGFRVVETTLVHGRRIIKEKVFDNMDFDPEFGCWVKVV